MIRHKIFAYIAALIILSSSHFMFSQAVSATLLGTVTDSTGASVPNVTVTITAPATGATRSIQTNSSGNYTFPDLTPGTYSVSGEAAGFSKQVRNSVDVTVNSTTRIDLTLQTGSVNTTVTVTDAPTILQTDRADVSYKMEAQQVEDMPLAVNRNFQGLLNLIPGSTPATFEHSQFFNAKGSLQTRINGIPRMGNSYQIEGIDDTERTGLLQIIIPPAEAIQTVDISTNNFEAELGRATGAVTNVILKSGTNSFHGFAEEFLQNQMFNAKNYFSTTLPHVAYNYFGGGVGGPILKNKLFFYVDYLRTSDHEANNNNLNIPLKAFSTPVTCTSGGGQCIDLSSAINPTSGAGVVYDPSTGNPDGTGRTAFANNQIPMGRVNPVSLKILQMLPAPNRPVPNGYTLANDYNANLAFVKSTDTYDAKVDYALSSRDRLSARYSYQSVNLTQAPVFGSFLGGPAQGAFEATGTVKSYSTGLNYNHTFSPTLLTEVRLGVGHLHNAANPTNYGKNDADTLGVPGVNIAGQPFTSGQVGVSIGTYSSPLIGYSASIPWIRAEANIDMVNHWTKVMHNHTIKFGADVRRVRDDLLQDQTFSPRGVETFAENQTSKPGAAANVANDTASFLLDVPSQVGRDLNTFFPAYRDWWVFVFAGDKWQATSKLTLDLGVRWEFYPPATPKINSGFSQYDYVNNQLLLAGVGKVPFNAGINAQYTFFAPRTGFAYRATDQTVIRGGFGISYTQFPDNSYLYNFPVRSNNSYNTVTSYGPAVLSDGVTVPTFQLGFPAPVPVTIPANGIIPTNTPQLVASNYFAVPKNYKNPYVMSYNLAVQQALPHQFSLQLAFVGNHGVRIASNQNINVPSAYNTGAAGDPEYNLPNQLPGLNLHRTASTNNLFLGNSSNYNSLQVQVQRRFIGGLASTSAFTWGKAFDYQQGDDGGLTFFINTRRNYAPADFDRRINFEQSFTYELPIGRGHRWMSSGIGATVLGGWKLAGIVSIVSGLPIANGLTADGGTLNTPGTQQTVNLTGTYRTPKKVGSGKQWFDKTAFSQPRGCSPADPVTHVTPPCTGIPGVEIGNTNRNQFRGPGFIQDNLSAFKDFKFTERFILNARVDAFQLSNTPQFGNPNNSLTNGSFGQVTSTLGSGSGVNGIGGGRALQLSAKLSF
ncbi:MAG: carboxypeptidase regulatory-like domain-containing protein [Edaphobacter sp.]